MATALDKMKKNFAKVSNRIQEEKELEAEIKKLEREKVKSKAYKDAKENLPVILGEIEKAVNKGSRTYTLKREINEYPRDYCYGDFYLSKVQELLNDEGFETHSYNKTEKFYYDSVRYKYLFVWGWADLNVKDKEAAGIIQKRSTHFY